LIVNNLARPQFKRLPARFQTATASFPKKRDQAPHLLVFLRNQSLLKPAESSADRSHCNGLAFSIVDWTYRLPADLTAPTLADSRTMAEAYASAAPHSAGVNSRPCARAWAALPSKSNSASETPSSTRRTIWSFEVPPLSDWDRSNVSSRFRTLGIRIPLAAASQRIKPRGRRFETLQSSREASSHKSCVVGPGLVQALPARFALMPSPEGNSFPADRKHRTGSLVAGDPPSAIRAGELCAV
jgi:hypothetical protein